MNILSKAANAQPDPLKTWWVERYVWKADGEKMCDAWATHELAVKGQNTDLGRQDPCDIVEVQATDIKEAEDIAMNMPWVRKVEKWEIGEVVAYDRDSDDTIVKMPGHIQKGTPCKVTWTVEEEI